MATYVDIDKLTYTLEKFNHRYVYDLPLQENEMYLEYSTLKTKPYKDITSSDRQRLAELTNELYDYIFFADDINNYASAVVNMQKFISEDFPDYVNEVIETMWKQVNKMLIDGNKLISDMNSWWEQIKNNIEIRKYWDWDNPVMLQHVTKKIWSPTHSEYQYNGFVFATKDITYGIDSNGKKYTEERQIVRDIISPNDILLDTTLRTNNDGNSISTYVTNNL